MVYYKLSQFYLDLSLNELLEILFSNFSLTDLFLLNLLSF